MSSPKVDRIVYAKTMNVLQEHGWCQGDLRDPLDRKSHCVLGAMAVAYGLADHADETAWDHNLSGGIYDKLEHKPEVAHLAKSLGPHYQDHVSTVDAVIDWNDHEDRSSSDVMDKLKELANEVG